MQSHNQNSFDLEFLIFLNKIMNYLMLAASFAGLAGFAGLYLFNQFSSKFNRKISPLGNVELEEMLLKEFDNGFKQFLKNQLITVKKPRNMKPKQFVKIKTQFINQMVDTPKLDEEVKVLIDQFIVARRNIYGLDSIKLQQYRPQIIKDFNIHVKSRAAAKLKKASRSCESFKKWFEETLAKESEILKKSAENKPAVKPTTKKLPEKSVTVTSEAPVNNTVKEFEKIFNQNVIDAEKLFKNYFELYEKLKTPFSEKESKNINEKLLKKYKFITNESNIEHPINLQKKVLKIKNSATDENLNILIGIINLIKTKIESIQELQKRIQIDLKKKKPNDQSTETESDEESKEITTPLSTERTRKLERDIEYYERQMARLRNKNDDEKKQSPIPDVTPLQISNHRFAAYNSSSRDLFAGSRAAYILPLDPANKSRDDGVKKNGSESATALAYPKDPATDDEASLENEKKKNPGFLSTSDDSKLASTVIYENVRKVTTLFNNHAPAFNKLHLEEIPEEEQRVITTFLKCLLQDLAYNLSLGEYRIRKKFRDNAKYNLDDQLDKDETRIHTLLEALQEYISLIQIDSSKKNCILQA